MIKPISGAAFIKIEMTHLRRKLIFQTLLVTAFLLSFPLVAQCQIDNIKKLTSDARQYERTDFLVLLKAVWRVSPCCSSEVNLNLQLVSPSGKIIAIPAYYDNGDSEKLSIWRIRFTPVETGDYAGFVVLTNGSVVSRSTPVRFQVRPGGGRGFLHVANPWSFRFDNGEPFRGIGENIGWESRIFDDSRYFEKLNESPRFNYEYLLGNLAANGGNFFRTWMCPWNLPLEWKFVGNTNRYLNDDRHFNASAGQRMDRLMELAESLDVYTMLTLDTAGNFLGGDWDHNNYNLKNGGPVASPTEFFTDSRAKAQYKDRLRYLVARWGYSPHLAAFEFFNEIDNLIYGVPERIPDEVITAWHREMSDYLKSIDPYHHLVTTSISHRKVAGLNQIKSLDFNQRHIYGHDGKSYTASFSDVLRRESAEAGKPYVIGECGFEWDWSRNFDGFAASMDDDFKKSLWLGLFSPTPILPMSWWWEYFDERGMTSYLSRVRPILDRMLAAGRGDFVDVPCQWHGPPVKLLGVQCGGTVFILLNNVGATPVDGSVELPVPAVANREIFAYDPERNSMNKLANLPAGITTAPVLTLLPASYLVLILKP